MYCIAGVCLTPQIANNLKAVVQMITSLLPNGLQRKETECLSYYFSQDVKLLRIILKR